MTLSASSSGGDNTNADTNSIIIATTAIVDNNINTNASTKHLEKFLPLTTARPFLTRNGFHETIVLPTALDAHKEAQRLYDEALKEFVGATGGSLKTMKQECETPWVKQHGCLCSGTVEKLVLNCRAVGINNELLLFSTSKFPETLIKL